MILAEKALSKAKIALMATPNTSFFCTLVFSLKHSFDSSIPTACTNGTWVKYNPDFFLRLTEQERVFLVLHEAMHVAYMHMDRLNTRNPAKWNAAGDYVINYILVERKFKMPKGGLYDPAYAGMSTEQVYDALPSSHETPDDLMDVVQSDKDSQILKDQVDAILVRAATQAKADNQIGSIPNELDIYINQLIKPILPWNTILKKYLSEAVKDDYSYRKPNRRYAPELYLPSLYSDGMPSIAVAIDTSASVTDEEFSGFVAEISKIIRRFKPKEVTVIQFDTRIKSINKVKTVNDLLSLRFSGRGGTCVNEVTDWFIKNKPTVSLVFTDGEFYTPKNKAKSPVVWLVHNNDSFKAPYGKAINYKI